MRNLAIGVMLAAAALAADAQAGVQASITCQGTTPTLNLTYSPGADGGSPGVFYVGITDPGQQQASFLDQTNTWQAYPGGLASLSRWSLHSRRRLSRRPSGRRHTESGYARNGLHHGWICRLDHLLDMSAGPSMSAMVF